LYLCIHLLIIATEHLGELNAVLRFGHAWSHVILPKTRLDTHFIGEKTEV
jgi:hypothetical protein